MGRYKKIGLDFFRLDVDFLQDIKIRKLIRKKGGQSVLVYITLLCNIYKGGYYMAWDDDLPFICSEEIGLDESYIQEVIDSCLNFGLFSSELFERFKILTSASIQFQYKKVNELCRRKAEISPQYMLISSEEKPISSEEKGITSEEKPISSVNLRKTSAKSTQIRGDKIRIDNTKENSPYGESKKGELSLSHPSSSSIDFKAFLEYFNNRFNGKLPAIRTMSDARKKAVKARAAEYGKKSVFDVLEKVANSSFLLGHNDRDWICDFNWIFKPNNFVKILEGSYDNKPTNTDSAKGRKESVKNLRELAVAVLQGNATKVD